MPLASSKIIHAPARGATWQVGAQVKRFNPRPRTGGDARTLSRPPRYCGFNPRARGATQSICWTSFRGFNPRPRTGGDAALVNGADRKFFNPRPRTGGDGTSNTTVSFSSAPARGATVLFPKRATEYVSIHAPARGATQVSLFVSIHAPARGATPRQYPRRDVCGVSIHAPARGATRPRRCAVGSTNVSIHAPARGATGLRSCPR